MDKNETMTHHGKIRRKMLTERRGMDVGQENPADVCYTYAEQVIKAFSSTVFIN